MPERSPSAGGGEAAPLLTSPADSTVYVGPDVEQLVETAFEAVAPHVRTAPGSVLYISRRGDDFDRVRQQWCAVGSGIELQTDSLDGIVNTADEGVRHCGPATYIADIERLRIVETTLSRLRPSHPIAPSGAAKSGLCEQVANLHSLLAFGGMRTADDVRDELHRLADGPVLHARADELAELLETYNAVEREWMAVTDRDQSTYRSDRYERVLDAADVMTAFDHVDAVVVGPLQTLSTLERRLVRQLAGAYPVAAVLPRVTTDAPTGADRAVETIRSFYQKAGFDEQPVGLGGPTPSPTAAAAGALFQGSTVTADPHTELDRRVYETPAAEVRGVARDIRGALADGTDPETIGVFLTDPSTHLEPLVDACDAYDVPVTWEAERRLSETSIGQLVSDLCALARDSATTATIASLVTNPLVTPDAFVPEFAPGIVVSHAERLESLRPGRLRDSLRRVADDEGVAPSRARAADRGAAAVELLRELGVTLQGDLGSLDDRLSAVFDTLGVDTGDPLPGGASIEARGERRACDQVWSVVDALVAAAPLSDSGDMTAVSRLDRALATPAVSVSAPRADDCVTLTSLLEANYQRFERTYVVGLTEQQMPTTATRLAYTRPVNEASPALEQTDQRASARHAFATILARSSALVLTRAQETANGDTTVPAAVFQELDRVLALDAPTVHHERAADPGSVEDILRETAQTLATSGDPRTDGSVAVDMIEQLETAPDHTHTHLDGGIRAASARAMPTVAGADGAYYGRVDDAVVDALLEASEVVFSPSALDTYATCGFRYYLDRILGLDEPDTEALDPDSFAQGSYLHAVLERFTRAAREAGRYLPATDTTVTRARMASAAAASLDRLNQHQTAFGTGWLRRVVAGLPPDELPVDPPDYDGVLVRFLQAEATYDEQTSATPALFEAAIGTGHDGDALTTDPAHIGLNDTAVRGDIDRLDTVSLSEGTGAVVHDYKASVGERYRRSKIEDGLRFQLPTYLLMLTATTEYEPLAAGYYETDVDGDVAAFETMIGDPNATATGDGLRALLDLTEARIDRMATAVEAGAFQPAFVGADEAGCRYCGFRDVCDVRHHRSTNVTATAVADGDPYVPRAVREGDDE